MAVHVPVHAWEAGPGAHAHPWDVEAGSNDDDDSQVGNESESSDGLLSSDAAAKEMLERLLLLYMASTISAKALCEICYFAGLAGIGGGIAKYGMRPGASSGHYQRHLNSVLPFKKTDS